MTTRRRFPSRAAILLTGILLLAAGLLATAAPAAEVYTVSELGEGIWVLSEGGGNILVRRGEGAVLMIDAGVERAGEELTAKVRDLAGGLPGILINTHHHGDHVGGNAALRAAAGQDLVIVGQANLVGRVDADQRPDVTFTDEYAVETGGTRAVVSHFGPGHTDNDAVVFLPSENILHVGDLAFHDLHPYVIPEHGADLRGWRRSLALARELCDAETTVVPGHGAIGGVVVIDDMLEYFAQVEAAVAAAIADGRTREEVAQLKPAAFAEREFGEGAHMSLTRMYDELTAGR